jgi:hypothetical protein
MNTLVRKLNQATEWVLYQPVVQAWAGRLDREQAQRREPGQTAATLRLLTESPLTDAELDAIIAMADQPFEVDPGEMFVHRESGCTWLFDGAAFVRTPDADVPPEAGIAGRHRPQTQRRGPPAPGSVCVVTVTRGRYGAPTGDGWE